MLLGSIFLLDWDDPVVVCGIFDIVFVTSAVIFVWASSICCSRFYMCVSVVWFDDDYIPLDWLIFIIFV